MQQVANVPDVAVAADFEAYVGVQWPVTTKSGESQAFLLNPAQRIVVYEIQRQENAGRPIRIKVLKGRQMGISTVITGWVQHRVQTRRGTHAISIADKKELPSQWLRRGLRWHSATADALRPKAAATNAIELYFREIDSRYSISSEQSTTPGMGLTLLVVHLSELSNWRNYRKVADDLFPAVPNTPQSAIIMESTGELEGDDWHQQVMISLAGEDDFTVVFLPWFLDPGYRMAPETAYLSSDFGPEQYTPDEREFIKIADKWARTHPEHAQLAGYDGISPEQVAWRRWTIRSSFSGDLQRFQSKYPATVEESFLGIGSLALPPQIVREHRRTAREPLARVQMERQEDGSVTLVPFEGEGPVEGWPPHWCIFEEHKELCEYAIGADVMEGKVSDPKAERSERDNSSIGVINRRNFCTVAEFCGQIEPDLLGEEMLKAGDYYNKAWIAPEVNNAGFATMKVIKSANYPHVLYQTAPPDNVEDRELAKMGWKTGNNRKLLISDWVHACRPELATGFEGKIVCYSEGLASEEQTFIRTKSGKDEHRPGCHDDRLFSYMIAWQVHLNCPHERYTGKVFGEGVERMAKPADYTGGVDLELQSIISDDEEDEY